MTNTNFHYNRAQFNTMQRPGVTDIRAGTV
jgi:hypothetical protein